MQLVCYYTIKNIFLNVTEFWKINHLIVHETIRIFMFNLVLPWTQNAFEYFWDFSYNFMYLECTQSTIA